MITEKNINCTVKALQYHKNVIVSITFYSDFLCERVTSQHKIDMDNQVITGGSLESAHV